LGAVVGHHLSSRGNLGALVGEKHPLAEDLLLEAGAGFGLGPITQAQLARLLADEGHRDHPRTQTGILELGYVRLEAVLGLPGLAPGQAPLELARLAVSLGQGLVEAG
jgi:hypothetical protein